MAAPGVAEAEPPPRLTVAVDDLGAGLWGGKIKQELEARVPLRNVLFSLSRAVVSVEELPIRYLDARGDAQLQRLRQLSHSPVAWFRSPLVHIVLASCGEYEDYKRDLRLRLKAMADTETAAPGQPELLFVFVRPVGADPAAKGPARVFDTMRKDLNRKRDRCVRLDPLPAGAAEPGTPAVLGLEEFDRQLKDALRAGFEARAAAYAEEVRRLMLNRLDPSWSFSTLFLVKDGLAAMLEGAGLLEDALREYSELEAVYLEAAQSGTQPRQAFGGKAAGDDEAVLMWASWTATRQAASQPELPPQWVMRQALFASQSRLLLKLHRHAEVAERGLAFARSFGALLAQQQRSGSAPAQLREAWSFGAYVSLAAATSRLQMARAEEKRKADARGGGRRTSAAAVQPPGSPTRGGADSLPIPIPLSPSALGITSLQVKIASSSEAEGPGSPVWQPDSQQPQLDWQLGALPSWGAAAAAAATAGGEAGRGREGGTGGSTSLYCLLGKLYCGARAELLRMGAAAGMDLPKSAAAAGLPEPPAPQLPQPPPAPPAMAVLPPPSEVTALQAEESEGTLAGGPSATDLAQLDLGGVLSGSSDPTQQQPHPADGQGPDASVDYGAAEVKLESAAEGQEGKAPAAAATPRQVSPTLQRLTVRPKTATDAESADSSPRSTSTHHSSVQQTPGEAQSDAGHAVAPSMSAAAASASVQPTLLSEQNDMRTAERQVVLALTERSSRSVLAKAAAMAALGATGPTAAAAAEAGSAGTALPPWLVHWRLRAALSSQQLFNELFIELSEAAAKCYSQCGYLRNAAMLRADVADALTKAGSMHRAADLYERQCRTFLREGWHALAAATLPKLAACQLASGSTGLAHTAAAMLSLPAPFGGSPTQRKAACQLLLQAAQLPGGLSSSQPLLPTSPTASGAPSIEMSAILTAAPPRAATSRFFGRCGADGEPLLLPPRREACTAVIVGGSVHGALSAAVGDALPVHLEVHNSLPVALRLQDVVLTLAVLQEMTVIHSARTSPRPALAGVPATPRRPPSNPATPLGAEAHLTSEAAESSLGGRERFEPYWQQVEELACSLVAIRPVGDSSSSSSGGSRGGSDGPSLQPLRGDVAVPPGASVLTFLAAPVHRGLYQAVHLRARLHNLPLFAAVQQPQPVWRQQQHDSGGPSAAAHSRGGPGAMHRRQSSRAGGPRGQPLTPLAGGTPLSPSAPRPSQDTPAGMREAEEIVLFVEQAQARVQLSLVAAGGSLIAGQEQWLGLALAPERDALHGARLELTWPLANAAGGLAGLPPLSRKLTPSFGSFHRAAHSVGGDFRLSPANSSAKLQPTPPPFIRPEHHAAVLLPASGASGQQAQQQEGNAGQGGQPRVLQVEGPSGPAASWMLNDGEVQQLALPLIEEGCPVSLWWRVTAGEVPMPPEPVHVAPPAPRHSSRQHDARRLAGLPADGMPPPAALLDLPASLEYASGCQRSHCRMLAAPMRQPFSVASAARELPSGGVAVQFTLTSNLAVPAQLASLALEPQPGFVVTTNLLESMGLLPTTLAPAGSVTASFLLAPDPSVGAGGELPLLPAKLQPSVLAVEYSFDSRQQCGIAAAPLMPQQQQQHGREAKAVSAGGSGSGSGVAGDAAGPAAAAQQGQEQQRQKTPGAGVLRLLSSSGNGSGSPRKGAGGSDSPTAVAEEGGADVSAGSCQLCSFRHLLTLEMPASEEATTGTLVFVRLLGPFSAAVGQPTTLCWRLERGGQPDQLHPAARISFEVQAESDHWRPLGRRLGGVTLAGHSGAVATVEATWVPLAAGMLPVPALRLQDVNFQEVFDVGLSGSSSIMVVEAAAG